MTKGKMRVIMNALRGNFMDWFKKHVDTVIILGAFASSIIWMNGKFNDVDKRFAKVENEIETRFAKVENEIETRFSGIEKDLAIIKTVLIMKEIMPRELAHENKG